MCSPAMSLKNVRLASRLAIWIAILMVVAGASPKVDGSTSPSVARAAAKLDKGHEGGKRGRIMIYSVFASKSHHMTYKSLAFEMARRGHHVTVVCSKEMSFSAEELADIKENLEFVGMDEINFEEMKEAMSSLHLSEEANESWIGMISRTLNLMAVGSRLISVGLVNQEHAMAALLKNPKIVDGPKFDVVMVSLFPTNEVGYFLAHKLNATLVLFSSYQGSPPWLLRTMAMPFEPAVYPDSFSTTFSHPMTFYQRCLNTLAQLGMMYYRNNKVLTQVESLLDRQFPDEAKTRPSAEELEKNAVVALHYGHPLILDGLRPSAPNYVPIGMMLCREARPIADTKISNFMNSEKANRHGVILVSFGTVLKLSQMPKERQQIFNRVLGRLQQQVLWKWDFEEMDGTPENVMLSKWLPQQDILAHPNLKLFVTHGGQSSSQEAWCHKKPMVVLPVFGDQPVNAIETVGKGCGLSVPFYTITEERLFNAISTVLNNKTFAENANEWGDLLLDQINKPMDRAVWWLEYAIRHPKASRIFRSPAHDLSWYQHNLLDVAAAVVGVIVGFLWIGILACRCLCCRKTKVKME